MNIAVLVTGSGARRAVSEALAYLDGGSVDRVDARVAGFQDPRLYFGHLGAKLRKYLIFP